MYKPLNPLLHSQLRLTIMSILILEREVDFNQIKKATKANSGNISVQIKKLEDADYLSVKKSFKNNYPHTKITITAKGVKAFEEYVNNLKQYIQPKS